MRRRRSSGPKDSLDLLIDTMCNAFGGIVMIAILIALLIEDPGEETRNNVTSGKEALEIARKVRELAELEKEVSEIETKQEGNKDLLELIRKRNHLKKSLATLQETEAFSIVELNERLGKALEAKTKALAKVAQLTAKVASVDAETNEQKRVLEQLENQMKELVSSRMSETRPPELRDANGRQFNIIVRYGEIFLVAHYKFKDKGEVYGVDQNESSIRWEGPTAIPIRGRGLNIERDSNELKAMLRGVSGHNQLYPSSPSKRFYIASFVYGDSFETINQLREMIDGIGQIKDGWEPVAESDLMSFSSEGKRSQTD